MKLERLGPGPKPLFLKPLQMYLEENLSKINKKSQLYIVVALSQTDGLDILRKHVPKIKRKNGKTRIIVGLDLGISINILNELKNILGNQNVFIYHNPADLIFHPKMYLINVNSEIGIIIIGSSNLTNAGLSKNFEINLAIELDLNNKEEKKIFENYITFFEELLKEPSTENATNIIISSLKGKKLTKTSKRGPKKHPDIFEGKNHGWEKKEFGDKIIFLMTLSYNDVSGKRKGDKYIRIPVVAVNLNMGFWGWKNKFKKTTSGKHLERNIKITYNGKGMSRRIYFANQPNEFRLVMPEIYNLGKKYQQSILKFTKSNNHYDLKLILVNASEYKDYYKVCTEVCPKGLAKTPKRWGYL